MWSSARAPLAASSPAGSHAVAHPSASLRPDTQGIFARMAGKDGVKHDAQLAEIKENKRRMVIGFLITTVAMIVYSVVSSLDLVIDKKEQPRSPPED